MKPEKDSIAVKDQMVGAFTYLEWRLRNEEKFDSKSLTPLLLAVNKHVEFLKGFDLPKLLIFDEPALPPSRSRGLENHVLSAYEEIFKICSQAGIWVGTHCCQTNVSLQAGKILSGLDFALISAPLTEDNRSFLVKAYRTKKLVCLGLPLPLLNELFLNEGVSVMEGWLATFASDSGLTEEEILGQTLISAECGFGLLGRGPADRTMDLLFQLRAALWGARGFSSTR